MAELKTQMNEGSVADFIANIPDAQKRQDCETLLGLMHDVTGEEAKMWGDSIVGFGSYTYKNSAGKANQWFLTGFSPRKQALTLYIMAGFDDNAELLARLGKHTTGKGCLYIKRLSDVDPDTLREMIATSVGRMRQV